MKIDLHCHTLFSDGIETPERMVSRAKAIGLDGIAITDHDTIGGWKRAIYAGKKLDRIVVLGKEIKIKNGARTVGEILALFLNEDTTKNQVSALGDLVDEIHSQDGIAAIPHPFDWFRKSSLIEIMEENGIKVDAIESINGRNRAISNAKGIEFAIKNKIPEIGGSDAHCAKELGDAYTFCEANDEESFRKEIKKGKSKAIGIQKKFISIVTTRIGCWIRRL